jgi:hypothetical protein
MFDKAVDLPLFLAVPGDIFLRAVTAGRKRAFIAFFQMLEVHSLLSKNSGGTAAQQQAEQPVCPLFRRTTAGADFAIFKMRKSGVRCPRVPRPTPACHRPSAC